MLDTFNQVSDRRSELPYKLMEFNWGFLFLLCVIAGFGFLMLYSVAEGWKPWALPQIVRFGVGVFIMIGVALIDIRIWMRLAYPAYVVALGLLIGVEFFGTVGMGAQRWIDLGFIQLQPSELMKISLVLALARFFHGLELDSVSHPMVILPPVVMIALPVALVLMQPDLGTSILLAAGGGAIIFLAGIHWGYLAGGLGVVLAAVPIGWQFLHDYQKARVFTFFDPERDPLGTGYHILQSKIALGSGGLFGRGFLQGTQAHLNFLPEKQTDFIFTMLAEELGLIGAGSLLLLYILVAAYGLTVAIGSRNHFGRLVAMGVIVNFLLYVFINVAMVMGLVPVVGVPLPLVSYGGTSMMTLMFGFGLLMSVHIHRHEEMARSPISVW
ncbi:MAG: rod shape-determining protein RodA [Alphaproteobacteria bacterium]